jgi:hypothetical protein
MNFRLLPMNLNSLSDGIKSALSMVLLIRQVIREAIERIRKIAFMLP